MTTKRILACVDCEYYHRTWHMKFNSEPARCKRNSSSKVDLVTGKVTEIHWQQLNHCYDERDDFFGKDGVNCGAGGKYWVSRLECVDDYM